MKTSISNGMLLKQFSAEETFKLLKDAGFDAVAPDTNRLLNPKYDPEGRWTGDNYLEEAKKLRAYAEEIGLSVSYAIGYTHDYHHDFEEVSFPLIRRSIEIAATLGAPYVLISIPHRGAYSGNEEALFEQYTGYYARMATLAQEFGIKIALKNTSSFSWKSYAQDHDVCSKPEDMIRYLDTLNAQYPDCFVACVDTGLAYLVGYQPDEYVKALGNRVKLLAVNDNNRRKNIRVTPGSGIINFAKLTEALKEIGYEGDYVLDITCNLPKELLKVHYTYAAEIARYFAVL